MVNIVIGTLIFGYAGWALFKFIRTSKEGHCASCAVKNTCQTSCSTAVTSSEHKNSL